jgi:hypothetical protein
LDAYWIQGENIILGNFEQQAAGVAYTGYRAIISDDILYFFIHGGERIYAFKRI